MIGRLAPSPTGAQHIGNARTYLIAWLSARRQRGRVIVRVEDIDSPRVQPGAAARALDELRWLGLDWDGDVVVQTDRLALYRAALERLARREAVYPCTCTRGDIVRAASAPHLEQEGPVYPGTCRARSASDADALTASGQAFSWRFRLPDETPGFDDLFCGRCAIDRNQIGGDFVVWKSSRAPGEVSTPAYQLAVVVDDAAQGVTEVVRGDDLIPSTPRQLLLYEALGHPAPYFAHVPLVVGPDGRRLAKRHGDTRLSALQKAGVSAAMLRGLLAWSCGWIDRIEPISIEEALRAFRLDTIPREPFVLSAEVLQSVGYEAR